MMSVTDDEHKAQPVLEFLAHQGQVAGNVWGDIYRNKQLETISNAPEELTPQASSKDRAEADLNLEDENDMHPKPLPGQ